MIGITHFSDGRVKLSSQVMSALQLGKGDQLFLYPDYNPERDEARLIAMLHPVSLGYIKGETRGDFIDILDVLSYISKRAKLVEVCMRRGRTREYSLEYVIVASAFEKEKEIENFLQNPQKSKCRLLFHKRVTELGEKTGEPFKSWIQPIATMTPYSVTINDENEFCLPSDMDDFIKEKLGIGKAKTTIQYAHSESGRLIILFSPSSEIADLRFLIMDLEDSDFVHFLMALDTLKLKLEAFVKRTVASPLKANVEMILDFSKSHLAPKLVNLSSSLDYLKDEINQMIRRIRENDLKTQHIKDVVIEIEQFAPHRDIEVASLDSLSEIQSEDDE